MRLTFLVIHERIIIKTLRDSFQKKKKGFEKQLILHHRNKCLVFTYV